MMQLSVPVSDRSIRLLAVSDMVSISGTIVTARDKAHKYLRITPYDKVPERLRGYLREGIIYHLGPIAKMDPNGKWKIISAGPTTSIREEPYEADIIEKYRIRAVIGKGGMGKKTLNALSKFGAVYISAVGGAATLLASHIVDVVDVFMLNEFGMPEAMWVLNVKAFPGIVSLDSHGESIYKNVEEESERVLKNYI